MSKHLLVAAIDFGTTYSSWAFSLRFDYDSDPTKVSAKQWQGHESAKGPTCILINPDGKTLHSFGFDAEAKYAELIEENKHKTWFFFKRFKMMLWKQKLHRNLLLEDVNGRKLLARTVFALAIKHLKDDMWVFSNDRIADAVLPTEIHWVLTVPAIWNNAAKQFMREAAEEAGIKSDMLTIALEPEAASLFCRHLPVEKVGISSPWHLCVLEANILYLMLEVSLSGDKLKIDPVVAQNFFKESIDNTIEHVRDVLQKRENRGVEAILMVGGFSESKMLSKAFKQTFPTLKMIVPDEAGLAVLKGAVMYGHEPREIVDRISKYTYGIAMDPYFDSRMHPQSAKFTDNAGVDKCKNFFDKHVIAGQSLTVGEAQSFQAYATTPNHTSTVHIEVFATESKCPVLVTDPGCRKVGQCTIPMAGSGAGRNVLVKMIFGGTEFDVECTEIATDKVSHITIDFLS